ncbi:MAG: carbohydrate ABC transporter permease [Beutenbergiaceae bacterium]
MTATLRKAITTVVALVLVVASIYPIAWMVAISLQSSQSAYQQPTRWIFVPDFTTYLALFGDREFLAALANSIQIAVISTGLCVLLGAMAAYTISRHRVRGSAGITFTLALTRLIPSFAIALPTFFVFQVLGLLDTVIGLILALVAFQVPLTVLIMMSIFGGVPIAIDEAATLDGAGAARTFWTILLPIVRPGLAASAVVTFVLVWNEFLLVLVLAGDRLVTIPVLISKFQGDKQILWAEIAASSVISLVPVVILIIAAHRHLLTGLGMGAVRE